MISKNFSIKFYKKFKTTTNLLILLLMPVVYYLLISGFNSEINADAESNLIANINSNSNIKTSASVKPFYSPPPAESKDFINCIFNNSPGDWMYDDQNNICWTIENKIGKYNELHFNTIHTYMDANPYSTGESGTNRFGFIKAMKNTQYQIPHFNSLMDAVGAGGLKGIYSQVNMTNFCYGQSLRYEAEGGNWGFSYGINKGCLEQDQNRMVLHAYANGNCNEWDAAPKYILENITENLQHTDISGGKPNDLGTWKIRPMMKIKLSDFDPNCTTEVARIDIFKFGQSDTPIKSINIKVRNFKKQNGGNYEGDYIEDFNFTDENPTIDLNISGSTNGGLAQGWNDWSPGWDQSCHVDFKVWWYGQTDVWIDYVEVNDKIGEELLNGDFDEVIQQEAREFAGHNTNISFFTDEVTYSNYPCINYIKNLIAPYGGKLTCALSQYHNLRSQKDNTACYVPLMSKLNLPFYDVNALEIIEGLIPPMYNNINDVPGFHPNWKTTSDDNYTQSLQLKLLGDKTSNSITLNENTYYSYPEQQRVFIPSSRGSYIYQLEKAKQQRDIYSPASKIILQPQLQGSLTPDDNDPSIWNFCGVREPTNEELSAQAMIAIAHGVDGLCWFIYHSWYSLSNSMIQDRGFFQGWENQPENGKPWYDFGLTMLNENNTVNCNERTSNLYHQNKWQAVKDMNLKIELWKPTLDKINWQNAYSVHSEGVHYNYIDNIQSVDPSQNGFNNGCYFDGPEWLDCLEERFWEIGFFNDPENAAIKYFMMVNRRCIPKDENNYTPDNRILRIAFESDNLPSAANTWNISEVGSFTNPPVTFSRFYNGFVDMGNNEGNMGWFKPGEGKLFKLEPVVSGGVMLADENISGDQEITLTDTLFTNGFNLTIEEGAKLHFTDSSTIVVDGGFFTAGDLDYQGSDKITFDAAEGNHFNGLVFNNADVRIYHSEFSGLANDTTYAVNTIDCPVVDIRRSLFTAGNDNLKGALNISCLTRDDYNIYIGANTFEAGISNIPFVNIMAYAEVSAPAIVENNTFNSTAGASALMLSGITGGAVKSNYFYNYILSVSALSSSIDVKENTISSSQSGSIGLEALTGTELRLNKVLGTFIGGLNTVTNTGSSSKNIFTDNSYYFLSGGENVFNVLDAQCNHLKGDFPPAAPIGVSDATVNCFKVNEVVSTPVSDVLNQGQQVSFTFEPYLTGCVPEDGGDMMVINLGDGIYDTLTQQQGAGGMRSNNSSNTVTALHTIYDSVCIQMRYRNYSYVKDRCMYLLNAYPDSIQSIYAVSKLYQAVSVTDTTAAGRSELKAFLEGLILNHPNNTALIKRANYFVQKCKVLLKQYSSALTGFQQIINSNPYSYEALVAHWDYMAASLLMNGGAGSQREMSNVKRKTNDWLNLESDEFDESRNGVEIPISRDDEFSEFGGDPKEKSPFTKEEKKQITQTVREVQTSAREQSIIAIQVLSKQAESGNIESKKVVKVMKTLEEVVKIQRPKNVAEHIQIVKDDLKKVFGQDNKSGNGVNNNIPQTFALSQNYPNPFNPVTKINYDLPKDCKVTMVIYDILGREVLMLVNNEFKKAGRYTAIFNGSNLASGVYFYRIEADKFVQSKKMVLVK